MDTKPLVGILMGSDSDLPTMKKAFDVLKEFEVPFEVKIISAHRNTEIHAEYMKTAVDRGLKVIIAGAGMAAHLPGVTAALTPLPVIGVPLTAKVLDGVDALHSIVMMPPGVPVATVGIDAAKNAGLLAVQILGTSDRALLDKFVQYKKDMGEAAYKKNERVAEFL